nr:MAG TPA: hypothetical protein [Caudoviricetes sp.]
MEKKKIGAINQYGSITPIKFRLKRLLLLIELYQLLN